MIFFATHDHDGFGSILQDAHIAAFATRAAAEAYLRDGFDPEDAATIEIETGRFSDCWIKTTSPDTADTSPFAAGDIIVQRPGEHPGGARYWLTPSPAVLVAIVAGA